MIVEATRKIVEKINLTADEAEQVMDEIMSGEAEQINMASFLTALRMKGETVEEITAFAKGMRKHGTKVPVQGDVLEIVGTGGDEANSINISTMASIVAAAAGYKVAKHGNRSVEQKRRGRLPGGTRRKTGSGSRKKRGSTRKRKHMFYVCA